MAEKTTRPKTKESFSDTQSDDDDDSDLWSLVRRYKMLEAKERQLVSEWGEDEEDTALSQISQESLITRQLEALAELDTEMETKGGAQSHIPGVTSAEEPCGEQQGKLDQLDNIQVPDIRDSYSATTLEKDVRNLTHSMRTVMDQITLPEAPSGTEEHRKEELLDLQNLRKALEKQSTENLALKEEINNLENALEKERQQNIQMKENMEKELKNNDKEIKILQEQNRQLEEKMANLRQLERDKDKKMKSSALTSSLRRKSLFPPSRMYDEMTEKSPYSKQSEDYAKESTRMSAERRRHDLLEEMDIYSGLSEDEPIDSFKRKPQSIQRTQPKRQKILSGLSMYDHLPDKRSETDTSPELSEYEAIDRRTKKPQSIHRGQPKRRKGLFPTSSIYDEMTEKSPYSKQSEDYAIDSTRMRPRPALPKKMDIYSGLSEDEPIDSFMRKPQSIQRAQPKQQKSLFPPSSIHDEMTEKNPFSKYSEDYGKDSYMKVPLSSKSVQPKRPLIFRDFSIYDHLPDQWSKTDTSSEDEAIDSLTKKPQSIHRGQPKTIVPHPPPDYFTTIHRKMKDYSQATLNHTYKLSGIEPGYIAECPVSGNFVVTDFWSDTIHVLSADLEQVNMFHCHIPYDPWLVGGVAVNEEGHIVGGVAVNEEGHIFVVCLTSYHIMVYSSNGIFMYTFGSEGSGPGQFKDPIDIACRGDLFIADSGNKRIQVCGMDGRHKREISLKGKPRSISLSGDGEKLAVCFSDNLEIYIFQADSGALLHTIHIAMISSRWHTKVCLDKEDNLLLATEYPPRVVVMSLDGCILHTIEHPELERPSGILVTSKGDLLVCDRFNGIHRFTVPNKT